MAAMKRETDDEHATAGQTFDDALNGPTIAEGRLPYDAAEATGTIPTPAPDDLLAPRRDSLRAPRGDDTALDTTAPVRIPDAETSALMGATVPEGVSPDEDPDDEARTQVARRPVEVMLAGDASRATPSPPASDVGPSPRALAAMVLALAVAVFALLSTLTRR